MFQRITFLQTKNKKHSLQRKKDVGYYGATILVAEILGTSCCISNSWVNVKKKKNLENAHRSEKISSFFLFKTACFVFPIDHHNKVKKIIQKNP